MIDLNCPSCQEELSLDEAFAGGVCRCHACGSLITVPAAGESRAPRQLVLNRKNQRQAEGVDDSDVSQTSVFRTVDGLEVELSDQEFYAMPVARNRTTSAPRGRRAPARSKGGGGGAMPVMIGMGLAVLVGILLIVLISSGSKKDPDTSSNPQHQAPQPFHREPTRSYTLDEYRRAVPEADDRFLMIQMNTGRSLEDARRAWQEEKAREAARRQ